eukprot:TRINITY_DN17191_c0_g1_i1.p1 TRINITY_DN17191_c0_g1~~TRINITY_DN17191_c0_g1_i1.p1  ORF type:complete len:496 (-),score=31.84 TRINITY_DN17191_c0_g1_i1:357-1712(-)
MDILSGWRLSPMTAGLALVLMMLVFQEASASERERILSAPGVSGSSEESDADADDLSVCGQFASAPACMAIIVGVSSVCICAFGGLSLWQYKIQKRLAAEFTGKAQTCLREGHSLLDTRACDLREEDWRCDLCGTRSFDLKETFHRCYQCGLDFCASCVTKPLMTEPWGVFVTRTLSDSTPKGTSLRKFNLPRVNSGSHTGSSGRFTFAHVDSLRNVGRALPSSAQRRSSEISVEPKPRRSSEISVEPPPRRSSEISVEPAPPPAVVVCCPPPPDAELPGSIREKCVVVSPSAANQLALADADERDDSAESPSSRGHPSYIVKPPPNVAKPKASVPRISLLAPDDVNPIQACAKINVSPRPESWRAAKAEESPSPSPRRSSRRSSRSREPDGDERERSAPRGGRERPRSRSPRPEEARALAAPGRGGLLAVPHGCSPTRPGNEVQHRPGRA